MKVIATKNGRQKEFSQKMWEMMPKGNYGWTAVSLPVSEPKKVETPVEVTEKNPLPEKVSIVKTEEVQPPKETRGRKPKGE